MATLRLLHVGKFYPPEFLGGLESVMVNLNRGLVRAGVEVACAVARVRGRSRTDVQDGVTVHRAASLGVLLSQPIAPGLPALVRRTAADIVHLHHPHPLGDIAALTDRRRPLVITHHSDVVRQRAFRALYGPLVHAALRRARLVAVGSARFLGVSHELRGFEAKTRVIPFGIDDARFRPSAALDARVHELRARWAGEPVVLAVGRLVPYKGLEVLLKAAEGLELRVVLVGEGPEVLRLRALAGPRTTFEGRVSDADLAAYYRMADVLCLPSVTIAEAFGIVLLEGMACGLPLITTALPTGVSDVNRDGVTGLVVPPGDVGALREALIALMADRERREAFGTAARAVYEREYTAALMVERYLTLYREALG